MNESNRISLSLSLFDIDMLRPCSNESLRVKQAVKKATKQNEKVNLPSVRVLQKAQSHSLIARNPDLPPLTFSLILSCKYPNRSIQRVYDRKH